MRPFKARPNAYYPVFCINLARREDRWQEFLQHASTVKWFTDEEARAHGCTPGQTVASDVQRYEAIDGKVLGGSPPRWWKQGGGAWGCWRSHVRLMEDCLHQGWDGYIVLEDDALFSQDFTRRFGPYLDALPEDFDLAYLGGQYWNAATYPPRRVNDHVQRPFDVNRTHAMIFQAKGLPTIYKALHCFDRWKPDWHVDHALGQIARYAYTGQSHGLINDEVDGKGNRVEHWPKTNIYTPMGPWLVAQREGYSDICSNANGPQKLRTWDRPPSAGHVTQLPFTAVLGTHSSGSSALAGVLWHLGLWLGNNLRGFYGDKPGANCGYEADGLSKICEAAYPFPTSVCKLTEADLRNRLQTFIDNKRREARERGTQAAGKYPHLCLMGPSLLHICGDRLRVLVADRPMEESVLSLQRRETHKGKAGAPRRSPAVLDQLQRLLHASRETFLRRDCSPWTDPEADPCPRSLSDVVEAAVERVESGRPLYHRIPYDRLINDTESVVDEVIRFLGLNPSEKQRANAIASVDPNKRHVHPDQA